MRFLSLLAALVLAASTAYAGGGYPKYPDPKMTPGELCVKADRYRYPEQIAYCERNVETFTKDAVIEMYDRELGYSIRSYDRENFKIDHYIPLCMGGSNSMSNLWPQHKSVYILTDALEGEACSKMSEGKLSQAEAVELIKRAKNNLSEVDDVREYIQNLN
jgi:hypothetical protein